MNVKKDFKDWLEAKKSYVTRDFEKDFTFYESLVDFNPFEIENNSESITKLKNQLENANSILRSDQEYNKLDKNNTLVAIMGTQNYFVFLDELKGKIDLNNLTPYFNISGVWDYQKISNTTYNSSAKEANWYYETRSKLYYLITLLGEKLSEQFEIVYTEQPNAQKGRGKINFKDYILAGFAPKPNIKDNLFIKISFSNLQHSPSFAIDMDMNFRKGNSKFHSQRGKIYHESLKEWRLDDNFPNNWNDLLNLIAPEISKLNEKYKKMTASNSELTSNKMSNIPLNQILYGPPGTGKTFNSINKAISILNPEFNLNLERNLVKKEYERLVLNNRITFTTFHQSMSYEDFIEGIKPIKPDDNDEFLKYHIQEGLFKIACANAAYFCYKKYQKTKRQAFKYTFDDLYDAFIEQIQDLLKKETPPVYKTLTGKEVTVIEINSNDSIKARAKNSVANRKPAPLTKENLQKLYDKFNSLDEIKTLKQVRETVEISPRITEFYAVFGALKEFENNEFKPDADLLDDNVDDDYDLGEVIKKFSGGVYTNAVKEFGENADPVVLIIDEINRGNISQIFGELITLIEEDKRLGNEEALEILLPYSKEKFGVPSNLYIIGTMNTADRSVEALDTALRRRFYFIEMMPNPDVVKNKNFEDYERINIMQKINQRVEQLLDRNYTLGHSYFIKKDFKSSFKNEIIPLLQEYFYNDCGKIGLILGRGFVREKKIFQESNTSIFADFETKNEVDIIKSYELIPFDNVNFEQAIDILLK